MATPAPGLIITSENQNFYRLIRLLVTTGTTVLRHIMEQKAIATAKYGKAPFQKVLDDPNVKRTLIILHPSDPKKKKVINNSQWNLLYPAIGDSDTKSYDISLLMILIRNVCGFSKKFNWDSPPAIGDISLEANIARLKFARNEICMHSSSASLEDKIFHKHFDETKNAILGICTRLQPQQQVSATDIEKLRTDTTDPSLWKKYEDLGNQWTDEERNIKKQLHAIEGRTKDTHEIAKGMKKTLKEAIEKMESFVVRDTIDDKTLQKEEFLDQQIQKFLEILKDFYSTNMNEIEVLDEDDRVQMDDIHVTLSWSHQQNPAARGEKKELHNYLQMFDIPRLSDKKLPRRILVEGTVGMGKSVFSKKICVDWANGGYDPLKRFQILLRIPLAEVEEHATLQEVIFSQIQVDIDDDTKNDIMSYIQENQNKILLVLDGYDEYSDRNQGINKILSRSILRDCCVIITSRPWKTADEKSLKYYDIFLELEGFKQEASIKEFTVKFMQLKSEDNEVETLTERFMEQLKKQNLLSFVQAPFLLVISCLLFLENRYQIPERVTEMYQKLMSLLFDRFEKRNKGKKIDRHTILQSLGNLSYQTLVSDQPLLFQKGEIRKRYGDVVFDAGFLSQHKYRSRKGQYMVSFPHKSFAEYLAAYYLNHDRAELSRFIDRYLRNIVLAAKFENIIRFSCGLLQADCWPVLQQLISIIKYCQDNEHLRTGNPIEHKQIISLRDYSVYFGTLLLQCATEGNHRWKEDKLNVNVLVVNENTYKMIPFNVKLCVQTILISGLEASVVGSIYRRLDMTILDKVILENQTNFKDSYNFLQQQSAGVKTIEIRQSKISSLQDIDCLKSHPALHRLHINDLELNQRECTPAAVKVVSQANINELVIIRSNPLVTRYVVEDGQILKKLVKLTTAGLDMMRLLAAKKLKMIRVIEVDNETIQEPGNHVNMKEFLKLITLNKNITEMRLKHCHVVMSRQSSSRDEYSEGKIGEGAQTHSSQEPILGTQTCQENENMTTPPVTHIKFDECSFVDEMGQGFQQLEIFEKLLVLRFDQCTLPLPLCCLLGETLSKLKYLQMLSFICRRQINNIVRYLSDSIDLNSQWKNMKNFYVTNGITSKEDMAAVMSMVKLMPNLNELRIYNMSSDVISSVQQDTIEPFLNQGIPCVHLTELHIDGLNLTGRMEDVLHTIKHLQRLEELYIHRNCFDDRDATTLLHFIENEYTKSVGGDEIVLPNLKCIYLRDNSISFEMKNQLLEKAEMKSLFVGV